MSNEEIQSPTIEQLNAITYQIRGAIFEVYNAIGPGLLESVYQKALQIELQHRGLKVISEMPVSIIYKGCKIASDLRIDLFVEDEIVVELKSVNEISELHKKQTLTYLRLLDKRLGILVNFNTEHIERSIIRVANHV